MTLTEVKAGWSELQSNAALGKTKRKKGTEDAYGNNGTPLREIMSVSLKLQKEKRGAKW